MKAYILFLIGICLIACKQQDTITHYSDYENYLNQVPKEAKSDLYTQLEIWNKKLDADSTYIVPLGKLSGVYTSLFEQNGNIKHLKNAEAVLLKAVDYAAIKKANYLSALARNYIAQHRFLEAKTILDAAQEHGASKKALHMQHFDVAMELGDYEAAEHYLSTIIDFSDFNYLVRLAKWKDHQGDLNSAIYLIEDATKIAEVSHAKDLMLWSYTNLGDYYGHAGRIKEAYAKYLQALEIDPYNAYAKKGIAWIVFSHEKNTEEARRIITTIKEHNDSPDYWLLLAEIADYENNHIQKARYIDAYLEQIQQSAYGVMYNVYTAQILVEEKKEYNQAIAIAKDEVAARPTPNSYGLLAQIIQESGNPREALNIVERHLNQGDFEPTVTYQIASIYKSNGQNDQVLALKKELLKSSFELGPNALATIEQL